VGGRLPTERARGPTYAAHVDFHRAIDRATRNPVYGRVRAVLNGIPVSTRRRTDSVARAREIALADHVEIFEAIAAGNAAAARDAMRRHILQAIAVMHEALGTGAPR
jgi:GntR family transcriptional regulator, transcriptional repressor for pyruvate dehydrogenase complex